MDMEGKVQSDNSAKFCPNCGLKINENAKFCKHCGKNFEGYFKRINEKTNVFAVFLGLTLSCLVTGIIFLAFSSSFISGNLSAMGMGLYALISIMFFGGLFTSLLSCDEFDEGIINSTLLFLISVVTVSFIAGITLITSLSILKTLKTSFPGSNLASNTTTLTNSTSGLDITPIINFILMVFLVFASGFFGGFLGVGIKKLIKKI